MATFALILQIFNAVLLIGLMAAQTEKAQQGGVMGIGGAGGRATGSVDMLVGAERILKPATRWSAIGFLFTSLFAAVPNDNVTIFHFVGLLAIYLVAMLFGDRIWKAILGLNQ